MFVFLASNNSCAIAVGAIALFFTALRLAAHHMARHTPAQALRQAVHWRGMQCGLRLWLQLEQSQQDLECGVIGAWATGLSVVVANYHPARAGRGLLRDTGWVRRIITLCGAGCARVFVTSAHHATKGSRCGEWTRRRLCRMGTAHCPPGTWYLQVERTRSKCNVHLVHFYARSVTLKDVGG